MNPPLDDGAVLPRPLRHEFSGLAGGKLVADAYGDPAAPTVVLLHGGGQTRHAWGDTAAHLAAAGWHALAFDARGHGESDWAADGDYSIDTQAAEMRTIWRGLRRPLVAVGASMGGLVSMVAAGHAEEPLLDALVLVDVAPRIEVKGSERVIEFMTSRPQGFASLQEAAEYVAAYRHRPVQKNFEGLKKNLRLNAEGRWVWHWDPRLLDHRHKSRGDTAHYEQAVRNLHIPILLVRGQHSDVLSEEGARDFLRLAPTAHYVDLRDAGHMVAGDVNDVFTQAVSEFLATALPAPARSSDAA
jgi:pimeloyl-ACP methyl ester carboxylesterase